MVASKILFIGNSVTVWGDDVAVPALGQSNFLLFVFGLFFILISSIVVLLVLDLWFLMFFLPRVYFRVFSSSKINRSSIVVFRV